MRRMGSAARGGKQRATGGEGLGQRGPAKHPLHGGVSRHASSRVTRDLLLGDSSLLDTTRSLLWRSVHLGWLPSRPVRLLPVSLVDLAGLSMTIPRVSSSWGSCLGSASFRVRPASPAHVPAGLLTADLHDGPVLTKPLLTHTCRRGAADRVPDRRSLCYLPTLLHLVATIAPGFLETWAAWHFICRSCSPVVSQAKARSVKQRDDLGSSCSYREVHGFGPLCPYIRLLL